MQFQAVVIVLTFLFGGAFSLNCYTCLNKPLHECVKSNQTCGYGMNKCFSMQKETNTGNRYTKLCADEWYCERYNEACKDLDDPEYSYLECNVGCCTSDLCNHGIGNIFGQTSSFWLMFGLLTLTALFQHW